MIVVKNCYFKTTPGLISGLDLNTYDGKEVHFIRCDFHPCCDNLIKKNQLSWHYEDCDLPYIEGMPHQERCNVMGTIYRLREQLGK